MRLPHGSRKFRPRPGQDLDALLLERHAHGLTVVNHETEMTLVIDGLPPARAQREELIAEIQEDHRRPDAASHLALDQAHVPGEGFVDVSDLECNVVDPDRSRAHHGKPKRGAGG